MASNHAADDSNHKGVVFDSDKGASGDMSDGGSLGGLTQHADQRNYLYGGLGRRQDGVPSDAGCSITLRRTRSTECSWRKRDLFGDSDEGTGDNSFWTERISLESLRVVMAGLTVHRGLAQDERTRATTGAYGAHKSFTLQRLNSAKLTATSPGFVGARHCLWT